MPGFKYKAEIEFSKLACILLVIHKVYRHLWGVTLCIIGYVICKNLSCISLGLKNSVHTLWGNCFTYTLYVGPTQQVQNTLSIFHEIYRYCKLLANCYKQMKIAEVNFSLFTCFTAYITCSKSRGPKCHTFRP